MSVLQIAIRAVVTYVFLLALLRISGKRVIAEATGMQFVLAILIGDLTDDAMLGAAPFAQFVVAAGVLVLAQMGVALGATYNLRVWRLVEGEPPLVIANGVPRRPAMRKERLNPKELASLLRLRGISAARWAEIKRARVEQGGMLGIVPHEWAQPAQRRDAEWVRVRIRR
jgi:uncharacterized membrane protein YcaP (DUF421 family)